jgi:D-alanyl-D-alanine carboxypeptidase/D-alanyl-D-alanine-endopeptidase (penicillin-binding protein 4)
MRAARVLLALALAVLTGCARQSVAAVPHMVPLRVPNVPPWSAADVRALRARLSGPLDTSALATSGIAIVDSVGRTLFVRRAVRPAVPASTFKLLVAVTALQTLGPDYRFETTLEAADGPQNGIVDGDVYLVGDGDPSLTADDLRRGVGTLVRAGTTEIAGSVVADGALFGHREVNPAWESDDLQYDYAAGTSALSLDEGTVEFHLVPAGIGSFAHVEVRPRSDAVRVLGGVTTAYDTTLSIERAPDRNDFTFSGTIAADAEQSFYRPVIDQPLYVAGVARSLMLQRHITVAGGVRAGTAPPGATVLWHHRSAPLRTLLAHMLFESDNHYAEQLLRAVGAREGAAGTEAAGAAVEREVLRGLGARTDGLRVVDGSGLAPTDRVAPIDLATLLARADLEPAGSVLYHDLPRVGIEGTVRRHDLTTALGRSRAKSGHIEDVDALAGYVDTHRHGRVAFAILVNDPRADDGLVDDGIDSTLDILATF